MFKLIKISNQSLLENNFTGDTIRLFSNEIKWINFTTNLIQSTIRHNLFTIKNCFLQWFRLQLVTMIISNVVFLNSILNSVEIEKKNSVLGMERYCNSNIPYYYAFRFSKKQVLVFTNFLFKFPLATLLLIRLFCNPA